LAQLVVTAFLLTGWLFRKHTSPPAPDAVRAIAQRVTCLLGWAVGCCL
jgi:hypothetical protein